MPNVKIQCSFCGKTNTKMDPQYASSGFLGLGSTKIGEHEIIDIKASDFYRCVNCGRFICSSCCNKLGVFKRKLGVFSEKHWTECPKCSSEMIKIN